MFLKFSRRVPTPGELKIGMCNRFFCCAAPTMPNYFLILLLLVPGPSSGKRVFRFLGQLSLWIFYMYCRSICGIATVNAWAQKSLEVNPLTYHSMIPGTPFWILWSSKSLNISFGSQLSGNFYSQRLSSERSDLRFEGWKTFFRKEIWEFIWLISRERSVNRF
jgi:hypothetical protein